MRLLLTVKKADYEARVLLARYVSRGVKRVKAQDAKEQKRWEPGTKSARRLTFASSPQSSPLRSPDRKARVTHDVKRKLYRVAAQLAE